MGEMVVGLCQASQRRRLLACCMQLAREGGGRMAQVSFCVIIIQSLRWDQKKEKKDQTHAHAHACLLT